jgi:hypothetical protein
VAYTVSGVALDNAAKGWSLIEGTKPRTEVTRALASVPSQGQDGVVPGLAADAGPAVYTFVVDTPEAQWGALFALFAKGGTIVDSTYPTRVLAFEFVSVSVAEDPDNAYLQATFVVRAPGVYFRDLTDTTSAGVALATASQIADVLSGLSAPVQDAIVRVRGAVTGLQVTDSSGAWFTYGPALTTTQYLRFESGTGRAYLTSSDTWTGGTEVSADIDFNGPRGIFELTPYFTSDPSTRVARLTVATASRTTAQVEVRGRAAYVG